MVATTIRFRLDTDSTSVRLIIKGHSGHSDVTRAADPLAAATLTCLPIFCRQTNMSEKKTISSTEVTIGASSHKNWGAMLLSLTAL